MLFLVAIINCYADCTFSGIWVWPKSDSINANGVVIIDGYATDREHVKNITHKYPAFLQSNSHKVPLLLMDFNEGGVLINQVVLKPSELLIAGDAYQLVIDGLDASDFVYPSNGKGKKKQWFARPVIDSVPPVFAKYPIEKYKSLVSYGCDPAIFVNFKCEVIEASACWVKTKVTSKTTGQHTAYYLYIRDGEISVGHGMCSGAFDLDFGAGYEVEFQLMDASGNLGAPFGDKITFVAPNEQGMYILPK